MWCQTILTAVAISYVICVLLLSGLQKEDLNASTLEKLGRHNVNIYDKNNDMQRQACLLNLTYSGTDNTTQDHKPLVDQNVALNTTSNLKGDSKEVNITEYLKVEIRVPESLDVQSILRNTTVNNKTDSLLKQLKLLDKNLKPSDVINNLTKLGSVSKIEENNGLQIEYNMKNQPDLENMMNFWTKLTHNTKTVVTKIDITSAAPNTTEQNIVSTTTIKPSQNNGYVHSREMEYISRILAEYMASQTVPTTTTQRNTLKKNNTNIFFRTRELMNKTTIREKNNSTENKNHIKLSKNVNNNTTLSTHSPNANKKQVLGETEYMPHKILFDSHQESIQVYYPRKVDEAISNENQQEMKSLKSKDIPYFERLVRFGVGATSPKPIDNINPIRFLDHLLQNNDDGTPTTYTDTTTDSVQPLNQHKTDQYDIMKVAEKNRFDPENYSEQNYSETVDKNTTPPSMKLSDEEIRLNNQYKELLSIINKLKRQKELSKHNGSKENPVDTNNGDESKIIKTLPSESEEVPVLRVRKLKHYQNYDFKAMLPSVKNSKRNLNLQAKNRMNNIIEMNKSQFANIRIYEDAYKDAINQQSQGLIPGINNYQSDAAPIIKNIEQDPNVEINRIQLEKPGETNQYTGANYFQFFDTEDKIKETEENPYLHLSENFMPFNIMPSSIDNPNQFKSSRNKYQLNSETDLMKKSNLYVKDNQFNIMPAVQNKFNKIQDFRNNQYQFKPRAINMKAPNSGLNRNKLLTAVTIQSYRIQESRNNYKTKAKPDIMKSSNLYSNSNQFQIIPALKNKLNRVPNFKTNHYQYIAGPKTTHDNEQNFNLNENQFNMKPGVANSTNEIQDSRTNYLINSDPKITNSNLELNGNQLNVNPLLKYKIEQLQSYRNIPFNFNAAPENINNAEQNLNSRINQNEFNTMSAATKLSNQIQDTRNKYQINSEPNIINSPNSEIIQSQSMMKPKVTQFDQIQDSKTNYHTNIVKDNAVKNPENPKTELNENQFIMKPALIKQSKPVQDSRNDYQINGVPDTIKTINFSLNEDQFTINPTVTKQLNPVQDSGTNYQINYKPDIMKNPNSQNNKNTHPEKQINSYRNPNLVLNEINTTPTVTKRSNRIQIKQPELLDALGSARNPAPKPYLEINDNNNFPTTRQPNPNQDPRNHFNTEPVIIVHPDQNPNLKVIETNNNPAESKQSNRIQDSGNQFITGPVIIENLEQNPNLELFQNKPPEKRQSKPLKIESSDRNPKVEISNNQLKTVPAVTKRSNQVQDYNNTSAILKGIQNRNVEIFNKRIQRLQKDVNTLKEQQNIGMNTNKPESISPNEINEIAERVKQIVLQDIRKEVASTRHTTMLTTTSEATTVSTTVTTTPTTMSTVASTTVTTKKPTTVKDANKEANTLMMQKLMQMFDEFKSIGKSVQSTTTSTSIPLKSTIKYKETRRPSFAGFTLAMPPPAFNPYIIKAPPIFANPIEVSPYGPGMVPIPISSGAILPKIPVVHMPQVIKQHNINEHRPAAITLQTNSDEIAPLAIQISKPLRLINQHILVTTKNPYDKLKMEQQRESKKRIDEKYSGTSNEKKHKDRHLLFSDTTKRIRFADTLKRHEYSDRYFSKSRFDKDKPNYKHEYGDMGHRENLSNLGRPKMMNRPEGYRYPGYFEGIGHAGGISHSRDYNRPRIHQDEINRQERVYGSTGNGHPRTHYEATKFHERLEGIESWPRNGWKEYRAVTTENCSDYIPPRQQVPLNKAKKRTRFDDTHFTNFLKSQQKVTDMLEKILASNMKATAPRSVEVTIN